MRKERYLNASVALSKGHSETRRIKEAPTLSVRFFGMSVRVEGAGDSAIVLLSNGVYWLTGLLGLTGGFVQVSADRGVAFERPNQFVFAGCEIGAVQMMRVNW